MSDLKVTVGADISAYQAGMQQASQTVKTFSTEASQSLAQAAQSTEALGGSAQSASMRFMQMRSGISAARDGVMAFTLGGQAAERSLMAMGHHINSLVNETGSFKGALSALGASLWGPGGIILGLSVAVELFSKWQEHQKKAAETQDDFTKSLNDGVKSASDEIAHLTILYQASQNENLTRQQRLNAVKELQKEYPAYFGNLSQEAILAGQAAGAYDRLTQSLINSAVVKAGQESLAEQLKPLIQLQSQLQAEQYKADQAYEAAKLKRASQPKPKIEKQDTEGFRTVDTSTPTHTVIGGSMVLDENKDLQTIEQYKNNITDKIKSTSAAIQGLIEKYGINTLLNKQEVVSKKTHGDDGFSIIEAQISELQNKLEDAIMNHDKPTVIDALGKQIDALTDKLAKLKHEEALALNPHLDDTLLTLSKPLTTGIGKGTLANGKESDEVSRIDLGQPKLLSDDTDAEAKSMIQAVQAFKEYSEWISRTRKAQKDLAIDTKNENLAAKELTNTIGKGLVTAFESAMAGTESFVSSMAKFLAQLIEKLVAAAAAAAILSVLLNATGIGGILGLSSSTTSFSGLFGSLSGLGGVMNSLPQHAEGGIATSASIGVFGEAGPEALIPLNRMHEFTGGGASGQNLEVTHRLSGADLLLTITRAQKQKSRLS